MNRPRFEDLACPRCGQREQFHVDVTATAFLDGSGPSVEGDYYWDRASGCACLRCQMEGRIADFLKPTEVQS